MCGVTTNNIPAYITINDNPADQQETNMCGDVATLNQIPIPAFITITNPAEGATSDSNKKRRKKKEPSASVLRQAHNSSNRRATAVSYCMIDLERDNYRRRPLVRSSSLQELAREHAERMAAQQEVFQAVSTLEELRELLLDCQSDDEDVGHNVECGYTPKEIHRKNKSRRQKHILKHSYTEYGVAAAYSKDGKLYLCEYYWSG
jgi:uncharacterized protein YkwD